MPAIVTRNAVSKFGRPSRLPQNPVTPSPRRPSPVPPPPQEITLAPMFDIFDAPVKLRCHVRSPPPPPPQPILPTPRPSARTNHHPLPVSLPQPIIFDGPSRLTSSSHIRQSPRPSSSKPVPDQLRICPVQIFDGPARRRRYTRDAPPRSLELPLSHRVALVAGTLAVGAVAGASFLESQ